MSEKQRGAAQTEYRNSTTPPEDHDPHWSAEWLVTNGLGGYASGSVSGLNTRGYHGYLVAALPAPFGRTVMLNEIYEDLELPGGQRVCLKPEEHTSDERSDTERVEIGFHLDRGLPVWTFRAAEIELERRVWLVHWQNTLFVTYKLLSNRSGLRLHLRPAFNMRSHEAPVSTPLGNNYSLKVTEDRYEVSANNELQPLRLRMLGGGGAFTMARRCVEKIEYHTEANRGYAAIGELWSPGSFSADLDTGKQASIVASTEAWDAISALTPDQSLAAEYSRRRRLLATAGFPAKSAFGQQLVLAADQFLISPAGRVEDAARAHAAGDEIRTIIAGYHWFTDWGRDTMISLEGLTLCTGRKLEASYILRTFMQAVRDGLIPNLFPEGSRSGLYHTADATLWFFHALDRYFGATNDHETLLAMLSTLVEIMAHHIEGTRFGIHMDPADALLTQGQEGFQLTWMDAKVDDWVVTPRRGKAVEINALWYNALRLMECWSKKQGGSQPYDFGQLADRARASFNQRFWFAGGGYLYDVVDGETTKEDESFRPNQLLAISLKHAVLDEKHWEPVITKVKERLLTPVGLRSLAPGSKDFRSRYYGDLRSRDAAYHQGTVWAWLIGPFIDAWLKLYPHDHAGAREFLEGFQKHLGQACIGSISEIFDAEAPFTPRGCVAQAWSVAEVLRCFVMTSGSP